MTASALPKGSCVLVLNEQGAPLVVNRRESASLFCFPGGKLDPGETFLQAAIRETEEETGLRLDPEHLEPVFRAECPGDPKRPWFDVVLFVYTKPVNAIPGSQEDDIVARFGDYTDLLVDSPFSDYNRAGLAMAQNALRSKDPPTAAFGPQALENLSHSLEVNRR